MSVSLFGIIWICLIFLSFFITNNKWIIYLTIASMIFQCNYVIEINGVGIGPQVITSFFLILKVNFLNFRRAKTKKPVFCSLFLLFAVYIVINCLLINKSSAILNVIMVLIYLIASISIFSCRQDIILNTNELKRFLRVLSYFVIVIGFITMMINAEILPKTGFYTQFFYNEINNSNVIFHSKTTTCFYSTFMEPSYCSAFLIGMFLYFVSGEHKDYFLAFILAFCIILTRSSTAYISFAICVAFLIFSKDSLKIYQRIIPILLIAVVYLFLFKSDLLNEVIFNKLSSSSGRVRTNWNKDAWNVYLNNPIFGSGIGTQRASSIFFTIVAELGTIGLVLYLITFFFGLLIPFIRNKNYNSELMVIGAFLCQLIAVPDLTMCSFWIVVYIYCCNYREKEKRNDRRKEKRNKNRYNYISQCI